MASQNWYSEFAQSRQGEKGDKTNQEWKLEQIRARGAFSKGRCFLIHTVGSA